MNFVKNNMNINVLPLSTLFEQNFIDHWKSVGRFNKTLYDKIRIAKQDQNALSPKNHLRFVMSPDSNTLLVIKAKAVNPFVRVS